MGSILPHPAHRRHISPLETFNSRTSSALYYYINVDIAYIIEHTCSETYLYTYIFEYKRGVVYFIYIFVV